MTRPELEKYFSVTLDKIERINQAIDFNKKHNPTDTFTIEQWERRRKKTGDNFIQELSAWGFDVTALSKDEWENEQSVFASV
jgi:hypothetical protein